MCPPVKAVASVTAGVEGHPCRSEPLLANGRCALAALADSPAGAASYKGVMTTSAPHLLVGITNSAPLPMLSGQRCITLFCFV